MRQASEARKSSGEKLVKDLKWAARKQYFSEEMIVIIMDCLRGEDNEPLSAIGPDLSP
jgi:hypothetical protein